jgi:hypothetical protein
VNETLTLYPEPVSFNGDHRDDHMKTIWKAEIVIDDLQYITVPKGAKFLAAQPQHQNIALWYLCDPNAEKERRSIIMRGTGHHIDGELAEHLEYIDTFQIAGGDLVFHVFAGPHLPA